MVNHSHFIIIMNDHLEAHVTFLPYPANSVPCKVSCPVEKCAAGHKKPVHHSNCYWSSLCQFPDDAKTDPLTNIALSSNASALYHSIASS